MFTRTKTFKTNSGGRSVNRPNHSIWCIHCLIHALSFHTPRHFRAIGVNSLVWRIQRIERALRLGDLKRCESQRVVGRSLFGKLANSLCFQVLVDVSVWSLIGRVCLVRFCSMVMRMKVVNAMLAREAAVRIKSVFQATLHCASQHLFLLSPVNLRMLESM